MFLIPDVLIFPLNFIGLFFARKVYPLWICEFFLIYSLVYFITKHFYGTIVHSVGWDNLGLFWLLSLTQYFASPRIILYAIQCTLTNGWSLLNAFFKILIEAFFSFWQSQILFQLQKIKFKSQKQIVRNHVVVLAHSVFHNHVIITNNFHHSLRK